MSHPAWSLLWAGCINIFTAVLTKFLYALSGLANDPLPLGPFEAEQQQDDAGSSSLPYQEDRRQGRLYS